LKSLILLSWATYAVSVSSGLSVADPKYFFPAALATTARPALEVAVGPGAAVVDVVVVAEPP
jgi:hypothetical protein